MTYNLERREYNIGLYTALLHIREKQILIRQVFPMTIFFLGTVFPMTIKSYIYTITLYICIVYAYTSANGR